MSWKNVEHIHDIVIAHNLEAEKDMLNIIRRRNNEETPQQSPLTPLTKKPHLCKATKPKTKPKT